MKTYNLTLIFYRANWVETCRCCVVNQGDSEFSVEFPKSLEEAEKFILEKDLNFALLVNGKRNWELSDEDREFYDLTHELLTKYWNRYIEL